MHKIETCFTPAIYPLHHNPEAIVVVIDILRATSAICTAFMNGVQTIIPVETLEEAKTYKDKGFLVAAERDGFVIDFADFGNSPFNFTAERVEGKEIVYSTTNGTKAIHMSSASHAVVVGAYLNLGALIDWLHEQNRDVVLFCAGWKNRFSLEDTVFAGALAKGLIDRGGHTSICDATLAAIDLWSVAHVDLHQYVTKAAQKARLAKHGLDDCFEFCHTPNLSRVIPVLENDRLKPIYVTEKQNTLL